MSLQPSNPRQAMVKRLSVVNLENFKRQYARRRWKLSFRIVALCNHLTRIMKKGQKLPEQDGRDCESDQEEEILKRRPRTRKRSSTSWEQKPVSSVSVDDVPVATVTLHSLTHTLQLSLVIKNQPQYLNDCWRCSVFSGQSNFVCLGDRQNQQIICCVLDSHFWIRATVFWHKKI